MSDPFQERMGRGLWAWVIVRDIIVRDNSMSLLSENIGDVPAGWMDVQLARSRCFRMPQTYLTAAPVSTVTQTRLPPFVSSSTVKRMVLVTRSSWVSGVLPAVVLCAMMSADILSVASFCAP